MGEHGTITLTGQASVNGRFRIELSSRDDMGQDWMVAFPLEMSWKQWSGRFRALHRSSHLGDEFFEHLVAGVIHREAAAHGSSVRRGCDG